MRAKPEYRRRDETQVAVLDALVDRRGTGMSVFELRARVDVDIDELEDALAELKADGLVTADTSGTRTVICPAEEVVPETNEPERESLLDQLRRKFGL